MAQHHRFYLGNEHLFSESLFLEHLPLDPSKIMIFTVLFFLAKYKSSDRCHPVKDAMNFKMYPISETLTRKKNVYLGIDEPRCVVYVESLQTVGKGKMDKKNTSSYHHPEILPVITF